MASRLAGLEKSTTGSLAKAGSERTGSRIVVLIGGSLSLQIGRGALDNLAAPFEHFCGIVRQLAAPVVHLLAAIEHLFAGLHQGIPAVLSSSYDFAPRHLARSRSVEQSDGCTDRDTR